MDSPERHTRAKCAQPRETSTLRFTIIYTLSRQASSRSNPPHGAPPSSRPSVERAACRFIAGAPRFDDRQASSTRPPGVSKKSRGTGQQTGQQAPSAGCAHRPPTKSRPPTHPPTPVLVRGEQDNSIRTSTHTFHIIHSTPYHHPSLGHFPSSHHDPHHHQLFIQVIVPRPKMGWGHGVRADAWFGVLVPCG